MIYCKDDDYYLAEEPTLPPEPECQDLGCYFHGGKGMGCMSSGKCVYEIL